jgi:hypothetical protein
MFNGVSMPDIQIPLTDDGRKHEIRVVMGVRASPQTEKDGKKRSG